MESQSTPTSQSTLTNPTVRSSARRGKGQGSTRDCALKWQKLFLRQKASLSLSCSSWVSTPRDQAAKAKQDCVDHTTHALQILVVRPAINNIEGHLVRVPNPCAIPDLGGFVDQPVLGNFLVPQPPLVVQGVWAVGERLAELFG